jgi:hypothetical protein
MSLPFDATLKEILAPQPEDFVPAFGLPNTRPAVRLNVDLSTLSAATDVAIGFGEPLQEIADLNFQSGPDAEVAKRCHLYSAALNFRFGVPVRTILILLRPKADADGIGGKLAYTSGASGVEFRYEVVRMWQQPVETFLHGGVSLLPLAPLCQLPTSQPLADAMRGVVREIDRRLAAECDHAQAARLMTAAYILTGLRIHRDDLGSIYDGVKVMHESSAYELILEEGAIKTAHRFLLLQGKKRLGPPDEATLSALKAIKDLDRLDRLADAVLSVSTWQELLATP